MRKRRKNSHRGDKLAQFIRPREVECGSEFRVSTSYVHHKGTKLEEGVHCAAGAFSMVSHGDRRLNRDQQILDPNT